MSTKNDVEIIKKILLKLLVTDGEFIRINPYFYIDKELLKLLKQLKEK